MTKWIHFIGWMLLSGMFFFSTNSYGGNNMPDAVRSVCVGRFVANLPSDAKDVIDATYQLIETRGPESVSSFHEIEASLESRADQYSKNKMQRSARHDAMARAAGYDPDEIYGKVQLVGFRVDDSNRQIVLGYHPKLDSALTTTEVHKFTNNSQYIFQSKGGRADRFSKTSTLVMSAATGFSPVGRGEIPVAPGFCVDGGMFSDSGEPPLRESFTLVVSFPEHPSAQLTIDADAIDSPDKDEPSLKYRVDGELRILQHSAHGQVEVLLRGERKAAGQDGYQIGISAPSDSVQGATMYKFFWAADGVPNDATRPHMEVDFTIQPDDGRPVTIKTADEAQALWESLLEGIRIRPGSVAR